MSTTASPSPVVVITGASSGIGRLTALDFARSGARVLAAARGERALATLEAEAAGLPGSLEGVPTDVSRWDDVQALAERAVARHGALDAWINAAAVSIYAPVEETAPGEFRRVMDVNFLGVVHGTRAALAVMEPRGHGVIVNVGSVESERALPLQSAYAASKHAVKGFTDALRAELARADSPVRVVLVKPSAMNTPLFAHARSRLGAMPRPYPPVYDPATVSEAIRSVVTSGVPEVVVGGGGAGLIALERLSPRLVDAFLTLTGWSGQRSDVPDDGRDNLDAPLDEPGAVRGDFGDEARPRSLYTRTIGLHPWAKRVLIGAGAATLAWNVARGRRTS